jgi:predicted porin
MTSSFHKAAFVPFALLVVAGSAQSADFKAGEWDLSLGGFINAYYTQASCTGNQAITGLALAGQALGCNGKKDSTVIGNGLLPNALVVGAKTQQSGYDISATLMIGAAVATGSAIGANSAVDVRQGFFTLGKADMGSFKIGRDYGIFGSNAILSDMTLLGVGQATAATQRGRVSLGHIGSGYSYLGHYGQLSYSSPSAQGFTLNAGLFSPVDGSNPASGSEPQLQAQVGYAFAGGKAWAGLKTQSFDVSAVGANNGFRMSGSELGFSVQMGQVGLLANYQSGKGLGLLSDGDSGASKQDNLLLQGTFNLTPSLKLGLGWGQTKMKAGSGLALASNNSTTFGAYYKLLPSVTLVGELSQTESKPFAGAGATQTGVSAGAILFF